MLQCQRLQKFSMKVGDLIRFKQSSKRAIYLGTIDDMYTFWSDEFGKVELWAETYDIREVEVISEG
tara:strand:- start:366 stop:563 length:198 start_codon:yes stop_codon:yes gene_type:complete